MSTTVAIPVWNDQVSTTFDFARRLLVAETEGGRELSRKEVALGDGSDAMIVRTMRDMEVEVLLCGAISRPLAGTVSRVGIRIVPYVSGPVDDILAAYLCGRLTEPRFLQPGCCSGARRRWRHQCRQGQM
jgi:predicted Fe-Mo cluster-binding NifX family protein